MLSHKNHRFHITLVRTWLFFVILMTVIAYQLYQLQIANHKSWFKLSQDNQFMTTTITPGRGHIMDRNGKPLAENQHRLTLTTVFKNKKDLTNTQASVVKLFNVTPAVVKINQLRQNDTVPLIHNMTTEQVQTLFLDGQELKNISIQPEFYRTYPCKDACASVTGYLKKNSQPLQLTSPSIYQAYQGVGGIEEYYHEQLSGRTGVQQKQRDAKGNIVQTLHQLPAQQGKDLILSIDIRVQKILHEVMKGQKGSVIITQPTTGEIIGLYSSPSFDPNILSQANDPKALEQIFKAPNSPLLNRTIQGLFPPASTVKPFLSLYALEHNIIDKQFEIYDPGYYRYKDTQYYYHNWLRKGHGKVKLEKALILSNDTFFYELGMLMGIDHISKALFQFGLSSPTGIDLPHEKKGYVPTRLDKENKGLKWMIGETLITVIGQGQSLVTPAQLAQAINLIANQGHFKPLHLLKATQDRSGHTTLVTVNSKAAIQPLISISKNHWQFVINAMKQVTERGTGVKFGNFKHPIASKTGTAQLIRGSNKDTSSHQKDHSWFIGFTPIEHPKLSFVVLMENQNTATLLARSIMQKLEYIPELWL